MSCWRDASFFYLKDNLSEEYKKEIINYLEESEFYLKEIGSPEIRINLFDVKKIDNPNPTGHLYLHDFDGNNLAKFGQVCKYVLSKDRKFIPSVVMCHQKSNYNLIERILKDNFGDQARLTKGFLWAGFLKNYRMIKKE